jgi:hypothetical protein
MEQRTGDKVVKVTFIPVFETLKCLILYDKKIDYVESFAEL